MTRPVRVTTRSTGAHQMPITLCQLKSRARPRRLASKRVTRRSAALVQHRGHQRKAPSETSPRKPRLAAPVIGRPISREPSHRCHSTTSWSMSCTRERKSTRLNSSHDQISYAVFCLKKKKKKTTKTYKNNKNEAKKKGQTVTTKT